MNLANHLVSIAHTHPDKVAVRLDDETLTYAELDGATQRLSGLLRRHGVQVGDRVALMAPNDPRWVIVYFGVLRAGAVAVPMNPLLKEREVAYYLEDSGARLMLAWHGVRHEAEAGAKLADTEVVLIEPVEFDAMLTETSPVVGVVDRDDTETAVLLYTSGTTGTPKGAELTHINLARNIEFGADELLECTADDVIFGGLPLFHVFGLTIGLHVAVAKGASLTLLPKFEQTKAHEVLQRDRVTIFEGVPTMYMALLNHADRAKYDLSSLRRCLSGGAALPVEILTEFEHVFDCMILEGYGLSETSPIASFNLPATRRVGSIGKPIRGVDFRLVDDDDCDVPEGEVGEVVIRGHNVMKGYWGKPDATAAAIKNGWFYSGDLARRDEEGFYFIVDRKKDMIIRGGYNVYPREIEEVIYEHPAVAEAAVVGIPDEKWGEEVGAVVALKPGSSTTADELGQFVKERVAAYKYPRLIRLVERLPKGPTGKILKREISLR